MYVCVGRASVGQAVMDPMRLCRQSQRRVQSGRKAEMCRKEPEVLQEIVKGAQLGNKECQHQFRNRRWNCTTARKSLRKVVARGTTTTNSLSFSVYILCRYAGIP